MKNYRYELGGVIRDLKCDMPYHTDDIVDLLEEKDQQIAELKKQLEEKDAQLLSFAHRISDQNEEILKLRTHCIRRKRDIGNTRRSRKETR